MDLCTDLFQNNPLILLHLVGPFGFSVKNIKANFEERFNAFQSYIK